MSSEDISLWFIFDMDQVENQHWLLLRIQSNCHDVSSQWQLFDIYKFYYKIVRHKMIGIEMYYMPNPLLFHFLATKAPQFPAKKALNTLMPRQNGRHFPDDIFKWIFWNESICISIKIPLKFVPNGPISNIPALVEIMDWRQSGDKPLSEPMMVSLLTHICISRPQWVKIQVSPFLLF